jgi:hypothetical protein
MRQRGVLSEVPEGAGMGRAGPGVRGRRPSTVAVLAAVAGLVAVLLSMPGTSAAADNPYQRGPDPTVASVAATRGPFATAQTTVGGGFGFKDATIYYPTDTSQGAWGALAIVPGNTAQFANEEAWMGPWLSSFGFVVIGIDTNSRNDYDAARGTQLLAALDYLTTKSSVRDRVDPNRLAVLGHSMGGGDVVYASEHRPSLKAAVGFAPFSPSENMATDKVSTSRLKCPYAPPGTTSGGTTTGTTDGGTTDGGTTGTTTGTTAGSTTGGNPGAGCTATYSTVNSWSGGFQGEVKVTAGTAAVNSWSVRWGLGSGQSISQVWNGTLSTSGSDATYSGSLPASASTTFGFLAAGTPTSPSLTCTTS